MCCTRERREVASFSALSKGSRTAFPLCKVCTVKTGQSKTLQGQSVCSELPHLSTHCHLTQQDTGPTHPCTVHTWVPLQSKHEELQMHIPGQDLAPSQVTSENLTFPSMPDGMDTANHRPCFREPGQALGRVWQCWAPVLGITCTWGTCGTHRDKLKEKGELNKAQFPEIWTEKAGDQLPPAGSS